VVLPLNAFKKEEKTYLAQEKMPIVQLSKFPASDALLADADLIRPLLEPLVKAEGCLS